LNRGRSKLLVIGRGADAVPALSAKDDISSPVPAASMSFAAWISLSEKSESGPSASASSWIGKSAGWSAASISTLSEKS